MERAPVLTASSAFIFRFGWKLQAVMGAKRGRIVPTHADDGTFIEAEDRMAIVEAGRWPVALTNRRYCALAISVRFMAKGFTGNHAARSFIFDAVIIAEHEWPRRDLDQRIAGDRLVGQRRTRDHSRYSQSEKCLKYRHDFGFADRKEIHGPAIP